MRLRRDVKDLDSLRMKEKIIKTMRGGFNKEARKGGTLRKTRRNNDRKKKQIVCE